jgi:hypothetical protein
MELFLLAGVLLVPTKFQLSAREARLPAHMRLQAWAHGKGKTLL